MKVVYKAHPQSVNPALNLLRSAGLNPVTLDNPDSSALHAAKGTYKIRLAVPPKEAKKARTLLADWERQSRSAIADDTRVVRNQALTVLGAAVLTTLAFGVFAESWLALPWHYIILITIVVLLVVVNRERFK